MVARERVAVLDSVHGVSKGFFEVAEVGVVVLWRRDHLQQPRLHFLRKTAARQLVNLTSVTQWIHRDALNTSWCRVFNVGTFCGMFTTPHPTWNVNSVSDSVLPNTNVIPAQKSLPNPLCPTDIFCIVRFNLNIGKNTSEWSGCVLQQVFTSSCLCTSPTVPFYCWFNDGLLLPRSPLCCSEHFYMKTFIIPLTRQPQPKQSMARVQ